MSVELADADIGILADLREWVHDLLTDAAAPEPAITASLCILTELVTNALTHGAPAGQCRLHLVPGRVLRMEIDDRSPHAATVADHPRRTRGAGGFGLVIVQHLASTWGQTPHPSGGKTVWAEINLG
ncbi:ATP-binding protein [Pseudonocardia yuanmonensis]|uniref:ATP-binding protein n=1 Tax=Pseudonocardia yuanmonensis TaxID=1095914 RepID=UPI0031E9C038